MAVNCETPHVIWHHVIWFRSNEVSHGDKLAKTKLLFTGVIIVKEVHVHLCHDAATDNYLEKIEITRIFFSLATLL